MNDWYIGTMGFGHKPWQGTFYPDKPPKAQQLAHYVSQFNALEMDSYILRHAAAATVERWRAVAPEDFKFCPGRRRARSPMIQDWRRPHGRHPDNFSRYDAASVTGLAPSRSSFA